MVFLSSRSEFHLRDILPGKFFPHNRCDGCPVASCQSGTDLWQADAFSGMVLLDPTRAQADGIVIHLCATSPPVELCVGVDHNQRSSVPVDFGEGAGAQLGAIPALSRKIRFVGLRE